MSDEEQQHAPTHKKATKVGGMRVGQDKAHHHASSEQQLKSTARSTVADSTPPPPIIVLRSSTSRCVCFMSTSRGSPRGGGL